LKIVNDLAVKTLITVCCMAERSCLSYVIIQKHGRF